MAGRRASGHLRLFFTRDVSSPTAHVRYIQKESDFELGGVGDRVLAGLTERGEMFFHADQDATGSRSRIGTLLPDIPVARLAHCRGLHQRRPALFMKILEMCIDTFDERITLGLRSPTELRHVTRTSRYDRHILCESGGDRELQR
jgi:hypothetical protein